MGFNECPSIRKTR